MRFPFRATTVVLLIACCALFIGRVLTGPIGFGVPSDRQLMELRVLAAIAATAIGINLSTAGVVLQSVLRNPLASPYVIGMTAGAALGVIVGIYIDHLVSGGIAPARANPLAALLGAVLAAGTTYLVARKRGALPPMELILVGVIVGSLCGSLGLALQQLLPDGGLATAARWMMGEIHNDLPTSLIAGVLGLGLIGAGVAIRMAPRFDAASLGDLESHAIGASADTTRNIAFGIAVFLTAGVVVLAGPIGFVGLIAPHIARMLVGPRHAKLIPIAALVGIAITLAAELTTANIRTPTGRVPLGIVTALIGAPLFVLILKRSSMNSVGYTQ